MRSYALQLHGATLLSTLLSSPTHAPATAHRGGRRWIPSASTGSHTRPTCRPLRSARRPRTPARARHP
eukprot:3406518-Prymnesium_polylepis.1